MVLYDLASFRPYPAGVTWSPDGACLLTASDDNRFALQSDWLPMMDSCNLGKWQGHTSAPCRLRIFDLPLDVLEARSLGNATELAMEGVAAAADTLSPALAVQVCPLLCVLSRHVSKCPPMQ